MNICKCINPKRLPNSAGGVDFVVCAKSQGGCGHEVSDFKPVTNAFIQATSRRIRDSIKVTIKDDPKEECYACNGGGMVARLYPSGHHEITCEECNGRGYL